MQVVPGPFIPYCLTDRVHESGGIGRAVVAWIEHEETSVKGFELQRLPLQNMRRNAQKFARGFTLIEIMVVVAIMGILAALIVPKVVGRSDEARVTAAKQDIGTLMQALKLYRLDNQRYPSGEQGLTALVQKPTTEPLPRGWKAGGYLERLPRDPWGNAYQYLQPGVHGEVDVFSLGADGQPKGSGLDADVGSWEL